MWSSMAGVRVAPRKKKSVVLGSSSLMTLKALVSSVETAIIIFDAPVMLRVIQITQSVKST
jgi:hypothetical protein